MKNETYHKKIMQEVEQIKEMQGKENPEKVVDQVGKTADKMNTYSSRLMRETIALIEKTKANNQKNNAPKI